MVLHQMIKKITTEYLNNHALNNIDDLQKMQGELIKEINQEISEHNLIVSKDERWKKIIKLCIQQVGDVILWVFKVHLINCTKENNRKYALLGIYIDDLVIDMIPNLAHKKGIYDIDETTIEIIARSFDYTIKKNELDELVAYLESRCNMVCVSDDKELVALDNGIFHFGKKELLPYSSEYIFITKARIGYNSFATNVNIYNKEDDSDWDVESWIKSLAPGDSQLANTLWEVIGAVIRPNVPWNKSAWLYSETGNNGKGTLCELLRNILGEGAYSSIPLSDFGKDFVLEPLIHSSAIIVDENDVGTYIDKAGGLKAIITNDVIQINRKFKMPITFQFRGFMVQCLNEYPRIKDKSESFFRRQLFIPMKACFTGQERNYIKTDYLRRTEVLEYIVKRVLEMDYYKLSEPEACKLALKEFRENSDPIEAFWSELRNEFVWSLLPFCFLYDLYKSWFAKNKPSGIVVGKLEFITGLLRVIENDDKWYCQRSRQIVVNKKNMGSVERLIYDYALIDWMSKIYKGNDIYKICVPVLKEKYTGIERI